QAEDGIRDFHVTGVQTCALPISHHPLHIHTAILWLEVKMQTPRIALSRAAPLIVLALAACSDPQPAGMTAAETRQNLNAIQLHATSVLGDAGAGQLAGILNGIDTSSVLVLGAQLPRGIYEFDHVTDTWTLLGASEDLELRWSVEPSGEDATLLIDWDATAATVVRDLVSG